MKAVELGKSVLIEKPFVLDLNEADSILAKAKETGAEVFVGYTQRFRRKFLLAKEAVRKGQLGDIVFSMGKIYVLALWVKPLQVDHQIRHHRLILVPIWLI